MGINMTAFKTPITGEKIFIWCTILFFFFIPLSTAIPNLLLIPLSLMALVRFRESVKNLNSFQSAIAVVLIVLVILAVISRDVLGDAKTLSKYALIIALFLSLQHLKNRDLQESAFSLGIAAAVIVSIYRGLRAIGDLSEVSWGSLFGNTGFLSDVLLWDRPYFGFMMLLVVHIYTNKRSRGKKDKTLWIAVLASIFIFLLAARLSMFLSILMWIFYIIRNYAQFSTKQRLVTVLFGSTLLVLLVSNDGFWQRFQLRSELSWNTERMLDIEPRYVIWPCAVNVFKNYGNPVFAYHSKESVDKALAQCYETTIDNVSKREWYAERGYNTHNQFLNITLRGGIILGIAFFLIFIWGMTVENLSGSYKSLIFIFFCFLMLENVLDRQLGALLFGAFLSFSRFGKSKISYTDS